MLSKLSTPNFNDVSVPDFNIKCKLIDFKKDLFFVNKFEFVHG